MWDWDWEIVDKGSSWMFDDAKGSHVSQSFIQDKEIKDIQDGWSRQSLES